MDIQRVGAQELDVNVVPADIFEQDTTDPKNPVLRLRNWLLDIRNLKVESADIGTLQTATYQKVSTLETRIDDIGTPPSTTSLQAYYSIDEVSEIPDDTSGIVYVQDVWATIDGWNINGGTISVASGLLKLDSTTNDLFIYKTGLSFNGNTNRVIRIKFNGVQGNVPGQIYYSTSGHSWSASYYKNYTIPVNGGIVDIDMTTLTAGGTDWTSNTITGIRIDCGNASGEHYEIDWIYIGSGAYKTPLINNTKDSLHGTIYGATKTGGINGNALSFDGVNDRVVLPNHSDLKPTEELSVSTWIKIDSTTDHNYNYVLLCGRDINSGYMLYYYKVDGKIYARVWGSSAMTVASTITADTWHHVAFTYKNGTGLMLYLDGVQVATGGSVGAITYTELYGGYPTIGSHGTAYYFKGVIDEMLIFSRAISLQEVKGLYYQKTYYKNSPYTNEAILARRLKLQTVSVDTTLSLESNIVEVITAVAVTLTIPSGLPLGHQYRIKRTVASANGISVITSGSETVEGLTSFTVQGSKASATLDTGEVVLEKISSTAWAFVGGQVSGSNTNGQWVKFSDGTMIEWGTVIRTLTINTPFLGGYRSLGELRSFPKEFVSGDYFIFGNAHDITAFSFKPYRATSGSASEFGYFFTAITPQGAAERFGYWIAIGRWK